MAVGIENVVATAPKVVEEAFAELTGTSKRKWAVALVSFLLGIVAVVLVIKFGNRRFAATDGGAATDARSDAHASERSSVTAVQPSGWRAKRAQIARTDAAMRARVGRAGSRLHHGGRRP